MKKFTLKSLALGLSFVSTLALANNPPPAIKADAPNRYVVQKGDTLWAIAGKYLDKPTRWTEIWATNQQIKNPHLIYPNDVLILCIIKGQTLVGVDTGEGCAGVEKQLAPTPAVPQAPAPVLATSVQDSIPSIPLSLIKHWLTRAVVVSPADFNNTPYVLASKEGNLITAKGDKIYTKGTPLIVGQRYGVFRKGEPYIDTSTGQVVGLETKQVAAAMVVANSATGITSLEILENYDSEVREGDRVFIEVDAPIPQVFYPAPATVTRGGMIARTMDGMNNVGKGSVVAINLGAKDGIRAGHVLDVYKKGKLIRDTMDDNIPVRLPDELGGQLMVFKAFNNISYAYVLSAEVPLMPGDHLLPPTL